MTHLDPHAASTDDGAGLSEAVKVLAKMLMQANGRRNEDGAVEYDVPAMVDAVLLAARRHADEDGLRLTEAEREALRFAFVHYHPDHDEGSRAYEVVERILADRLTAEPDEAASVGDGLAGVLALMTEHVRISTAGMAGESRRGFWMCACREWGHDKDGDRTRGHRAHVAAVIVRDWLPGETARLRAKVERVEALAERVAENGCGHPTFHTSGDGNYVPRWPGGLCPVCEEWLTRLRPLAAHPEPEPSDLPEAHRAVIDECVAEAWRNFENGDPEAQTAEDAAADIAQHLVNVFDVVTYPREEHMAEAFPRDARGEHR